ncbi:MAG: oligosaccharide flippase family protein [Lutibacter sp.]|uniref:oligosaccharide flippase family protein n=1 Tax=Lutibacter sp. TaxID=1925666 RepID=UPI0018382BA4|nr:oligosaccharide flippase family protein [Lutibacter sp.]MBT8317613.1 oligosaccharide flippase family protein [Lutibacter sp.]NNJ58472.1 oligosaccharide flippase family protein [Lutibacter sp.]
MKTPLSYFQKNILLMFKGTFLAKVIGVVGSVILAKIYGSEAFGFFGVFLSTSTFLALLNTLQLDYSIVTTKNKEESMNLMNSLFVITFIISSLSFLIYYVFLEFLLFNSYSFSLIFVSIFASIILSFNKIHESHFTYIKNFKSISFAKIIVTSFTIIFQIFLYNYFRLMGLIYGNLISLTLVSTYYFLINKNMNPINFKRLLKTIKHNNSILKYMLPSSLINSIALNLIPILIASLFNIVEYGIYYLSLKILSVPLFLITSSVSQVYYEKSAKMYQRSKEKLYKLTKRIVLINMIIMLIYLAFINTIGIYLLELIFNKNWDNLRIFTYILSFIVLARTSFNPISDIVVILNKNYISLLFNIYLLIVNIFAIFIGYRFNNLIYSITIISILGGVGYFINLFYFLSRLKEFEN